MKPPQRKLQPEEIDLRHSRLHLLQQLLSNTVPAPVKVYDAQGRIVREITIHRPTPTRKGGV